MLQRNMPDQAISMFSQLVELSPSVRRASYGGIEFLLPHKLTLSSRAIDSAYLHSIPSNHHNVLDFASGHRAPLCFMDTRLARNGVDYVHQPGQELLDDLLFCVILELPRYNLGQGCIDHGTGLAVEVSVDLVYLRAALWHVDRCFCGFV